MCACWREAMVMPPRHPAFEVRLVAAAGAFLWLCAGCAFLRTAGGAAESPWGAITGELLSRAPVLMRLRGVLDAAECAAVRRLLLDAVLYFNDTWADGTVRPGAERLGLGEAPRPRYRMQQELQLTLFFERPPEVLETLHRRIANVVNVTPAQVEAIYHVYAPGARPSNLHLDNFNAFLYPHRMGSVSVFFDDLEDGGTIFPLLLPHGDGFGTASEVAWEADEVALWQAQIAESFADPTNIARGYLCRRVQAEESHPFRRRTFEAALAMCRGGRASQHPVLPERGAAYVWRNFAAGGTDDVRTVHAGCGASESFKTLGTLFLRSGPGPFAEHGAFWDPLEELADPTSEKQRQVEMLELQHFRLQHLVSLYELQREAEHQLFGVDAAQRLCARQQVHLSSLLNESVARGLRARLGDFQEQHRDGLTVHWQRSLARGRVF
uniref:Prolyl 4-hydroxylase alpha subunit domain-containing protein n=1 Tax=Alexandrium monilatum TaxID=311494 RepID=A0A7S4V2Q1_9DINO